jgi:alcohol dehydrogenase class IV
MVISSLGEAVHVHETGALDFTDSDAFVSDFLGDHNVLLVAGRHSYQESGAAQLIDPHLKGRKVIRFSDFTANPQITDLEKALKIISGIGINRIIAVGGGSALDMGKLVNFFASSGLRPYRYLHGTAVSGPEKLMPLLAIPTTAGTGSEATHFAVLYAESIKYSIAAPHLKPSHVLLNAEFTRSLSPFQTACSGFDALAHAVESTWAVSATTESRRHSLEALKFILRSLTVNVKSPDQWSRGDMMKGAFLAGQAINDAKTTAAHALSYSLTAHENVPHGQAVSFFLPSVARVNVERMLVSDGNLRDVARILCDQFNCGTARELEKKLCEIRNEIGLDNPELLRGNCGLDHVCRRIEKEVNVDRLSNNPIMLSSDELRSIILAGIKIGEVKSDKTR